ncbi:homoserine kinase [Companilactobacillus farciminis]|uniref:homoserine kinase n=1 Tax=Companilactobacillus farciminis TaxID=1612 RepID=UPI0023311941|nr:homoserine kinase [Companilactobacillus farciminis]WCG35108.1 homoserine kinase [Companilactobacillus farciminis]
MIRIKVPATSANLGVGFDCMGLAVSLYSTIDFEQSSQKLIISGCDEQFQNEQNLIYQAFVRGCQFLNQPVPNVKITIDNHVPVSRGLGSSAVCIVGGLMGANLWFDSPLAKEEILTLATEMEGHPDNVAPAILGNLNVSFTDSLENIQNVAFKVSSDLFFVALIPDYQLSTKKARQVLPKSMDYQTVSYQVGHAVALSKALENGDLQLIRQAIIDKMHEPFRSKLIPDYSAVKSICEKDGGVLYISGSGSTLMAIASNLNDAQKIIDETKKSFPNWETHLLSVDTKGANGVLI